jgi:two-component system phosphate regulon response regulator PhoB
MSQVQASPLVLVADDDRDILSLVALGLERSGYRVLQASDGAEALEVALREQPDLAVLDLMMPGMTGLEVTRALRDDERTRDLPVILLTARVQETDVQAGLAAGATAYVEKPFSLTELCKQAEGLLGARLTASAGML